MNELSDRYNRTGAADLRNNYIDSVISSQGEQSNSNEQANMQESITNSKNSRKKYLDSLTAGLE